MPGYEIDANDQLFAAPATFRLAAGIAVQQGIVSRGDVLDGSLRRLLRGGRPGVLGSHLSFWTWLDPTDQEISERASVALSLLSSPNGTVARTFLAALRQASDAGLLDVDLAVEAAAVAVARPEKNVVKSTVGWLDALAAAHPDRVGQIAGIVMAASGALSADLQERAVKLIGKHATHPHVRQPNSLLELVPGVWNASERQADEAEWDLCWPAIIPARPDLAAVALTGGVDWQSAAPAPESAIILAEQDGPHGATHHMIADRLVHPDARVRASGVDAALILASRGLLAPVLLGDALAGYLAGEPGQALLRATPALRDLANGGAATPTWEAISHLLPRILPPAVPKALSGTADLLALAAELAAAQPDRMVIAEVTALAQKKGTGAVRNGARRLAAVLLKDDAAL
jgi:hypothetical protein